MLQSNVNFICIMGSQCPGSAEHHQSEGDDQPGNHQEQGPEARMYETGEEGGPLQMFEAQVDGRKRR